MNGRRGRGWRPREFNGSYVGIPTDNLSLQCAELGYLGVAGEPSSSRRELSPAAGGPAGGAFLHLSGRNSTYRPVQILEAGSLFAFGIVVLIMSFIVSALF